MMNTVGVAHRGIVKDMALTAFGVAFLALGGHYYYKGRSTLDADRATIRNMGIPSTPEELASLAPRSGSNAAIFYSGFCQNYDHPSSDQQVARLLLRNPDYTDSTHPRIKTIQQALPILRQMAGTLSLGAQQSHWTLVYSQPPPQRDPMAMYGTAESYKVASQFNDVGAIYNGILFLLSLSKAELTYGDPNKAVDDLDIAEKICGQIAANPGTDFVKKSMDWETEILGGYLQIETSPQGKDPKLLKKIEANLSHFPAQPSMRNTMVAQYQDDFHAVVDRLVSPLQYVDSPWVRMRETYTRVSKTRYMADLELKMWRETFEALPTDPADWQGAAQVAAIVTSNHASDPLLKIAPGVEHDYPQLWKDQIVRRHTMLAFTRVLSTKLTTGKYPPAVPGPWSDVADPYSSGDQPVKLKVSGENFSVYSIGANGVDDGGKDMRSATSPDQGTYYNAAHERDSYYDMYGGP